MKAVLDSNNLDPVRKNTLDVFINFYPFILKSMDGSTNLANKSSNSWFKFITEVLNISTYRFGSSSQINDFEMAVSDLLLITESVFTSIRPPIIVSSNPFQSIRASLSNNFERKPLSAFIEEDVFKAKALALEFFQGMYPSKSKSITSFNIILLPSKTTYLSHLNQRNGNKTDIYFYFCPSSFYFFDYLNLPFYFFHEFSSHIFPAQMFLDTLKPNHSTFQHGIFEDGWMVYLQYDYYWESIISSPYEWIKFEALDDFIYRTCAISNVTKRGFDLAKWFFRQVVINDVSLFRKISLQLANMPYNYNGHQDIQSEFIFAVEAYRQRGEITILQKKVNASSNIEKIIEKIISEYPVT